MTSSPDRFRRLWENFRRRYAGPRGRSCSCFSDSANRAKLFCLFVCAAACLIAGCNRNKPSTRQLRAITHDLVAAAQKAAGRSAEIAIRPEMRPASAGNPASVAADNIYITLADATDRSKVERALDAVADRDGLSRVNSASSPGVTRFDYRLDGQRTHTVHIIVARQSSENSQASPGARGVRLAIIIDDLGYDQAAADRVLALRIPLTLAVLPNHPLSAQIAEEARRRGDQVILHFPMEPEANSPGNDTGVEAVELHVGMRPEQVDRTLESMLATVPGAIGANNHEGSRATADPALMAAVMEALHRRGLFFIDSRTTAQTVAYETAEREGVPAASRKVFLDDVISRSAVLQQLDLAARDARTLGSAIAIGHPHPETIAAIEEDVPKLEAQNIRFVFVSQLVH